MKNLLIVTADTNDADYVSEISEVKSDALDRIIVILDKINKAGKFEWNGFPWGKGEYADTGFQKEYADILSEEEMEYFNGFTPYGEHGIHTISRIDLYRNIGDKEGLMV